MIRETVRGESEAQEFSLAVGKIVSESVRQHEIVHGQEGADPKEFHLPEHLRRVWERSGKIASVFALSPRRRQLIEIGAAIHDLEINYTPADPKELLAMITRHRGARDGDKPNGANGNEARSAGCAKKRMFEANTEAGRELFSQQEIATVVWEIDATYPDVNLGPDFKGLPFDQYPFFSKVREQNRQLDDFLSELKESGITKGPLFSQPHLEKPLEAGLEVPPEVLIIGLTDLGAAGMDSKEIFFSEGDAEMRELYGNLRKPEVFRGLCEIPEKSGDRAKVAQAFLSWLDSQPGFATWQWLRLEKIILLLKREKRISPAKEKKLRDLFSRFEENIKAAQRRAQKIRSDYEGQKTINEQEAFKKLAKEVGYKD